MGVIEDDKRVAHRKNAILLFTGLDRLPLRRHSERIHKFEIQGTKMFPHFIFFSAQKPEQLPTASSSSSYLLLSPYMYHEKQLINQVPEVEYGVDPLLVLRRCEGWHHPRLQVSIHGLLHTALQAHVVAKAIAAHIRFTDLVHGVWMLAHA